METIIVVAVLIGMCWLLLIKMLAYSIRTNRKMIKTYNKWAGENIVKRSTCKATIIHVNKQLEKHTDDEFVSILRERLDINNGIIRETKKLDKITKAVNDSLVKRNKRYAYILKMLTFSRNCGKIEAQ